MYGLQTGEDSKLHCIILQQCMNIKQNVPFNHSTHSSTSLYNPC